MAKPTYTRSANHELQEGVHEGGEQRIGKDWCTPGGPVDIEFPEHAGPCYPGCGRMDHGV